MYKLKCTNSYYSLCQGDWIYRLFMDQACLYENKEQYCKANNTLHEVISQSNANGIISQPLKEAI